MSMESSAHHVQVRFDRHKFCSLVITFSHLNFKLHVNVLKNGVICLPIFIRSYLPSDL